MINNDVPIKVCVIEIVKINSTTTRIKFLLNNQVNQQIDKIINRFAVSTLFIQ